MPSSLEASQPEAQGNFQPSWVLEKQKEFEDPYLQRTAGALHKTPEPMLTRNRLEEVYFRIQDKTLEGTVDIGEADTLMARISTRIEEIGTTISSPVTSAEVRIADAAERIVQAAENNSVTIRELVALRERSGQLQPSLTPEQVEQISTAQAMAVEQQRTEALRGIFGRLPLELEMSRWVDVEYDQEFYTRFQPNQEPNFYTSLGTEQRKIWDARWRLARAAYVKKVLSAQPEKLAENQDLIELTKEQMETLYNIPGVKFALEWYAKAIIVPNGEHKIGEKTVLECESGADFEAFRKMLRSKIKALPGFNIQQEEDEMSLEDRTKVVSADAIAWNLICCGNLVESIDSRYSVIRIEITDNVKEEWQRRGAKIEEHRNNRGEVVRMYAIVKGLGRHGNLAPAVCSDDLRAVFHPQEKFEDKCRNNQEWGNFGKWGATQLKRIKNEFREDLEDRDRERRARIVFKPARRTEEFWTARIEERDIEVDGERKTIREVAVKTPECYPITSMKSFFETYRDNGTTLLEKLVSGQPIDWREVQADPWKTNYLTIRLRKAVGFFAIFTADSKEGWTRALIDIYTRLNSRGVLEEYYEGTLNLPVQKIKQEAERLANIHFHNLKVWADYAVQGGVGGPQDRLVTDPYSPSILGRSTGWNRTIHETILRKPQVAYLGRGESLLIASVK